MDGDEIRQVDAAVAAAIGRWPEIAAAAGVLPADVTRAQETHTRLAASFALRCLRERPSARSACDLARLTSAAYHGIRIPVRQVIQIIRLAVSGG